jgi:hypothetical protein
MYTVQGLNICAPLIVGYLTAFDLQIVAVYMVIVQTSIS